MKPWILILILLNSFPLAAQVSPADIDSRRVHEALLLSFMSNDVWGNGVVRVEVDRHQVAAYGIVQDEKTAQKITAILQMLSGDRNTRQALEIRPFLPSHDQLVSSPIAQTNPRLLSYCDVRGLTEPLVPRAVQEQMTRLRIQKFIHEMFRKSLSIRFTAENMSIAGGSEPVRQPGRKAHPAIREGARRIVRESDDLIASFKILLPEFENSSLGTDTDDSLSRSELLNRLTGLTLELYSYINSYFYPQKSRLGTVTFSDLTNPAPAALLNEIQLVARKVERLS